MVDFGESSVIISFVKVYPDGVDSSSPKTNPRIIVDYLADYFFCKMLVT